MSKTVESIHIPHPTQLGQPAGINWPKPIQALINEWETAWTEYQTISAERVETFVLYQGAHAADNELLAQALIDGKGDPGTINHDKYSRKYEVDSMRLMQAYQTAERISGRFYEAIREHGTEVYRACLEASIAQHDVWVEATTAAAEAIAAANRATNGIVAPNNWARKALNLNRHEINFQTTQVNVSTADGLAARKTLEQLLDELNDDDAN